MTEPKTRGERFTQDALTELAAVGVDWPANAPALTSQGDAAPAFRQACDAVRPLSLSRVVDARGAWTRAFLDWLEDDG